MSKARFFGTKDSKTNKVHQCFWCMRDIPKGTPDVRHDTWNERNKMTNKYFCVSCDWLLSTQESLCTWKDEPYNPVKWEIMMRFPLFFEDPFFKRELYERTMVLLRLQKLFSSKYDLTKYRIAKYFGITSWYIFTDVEFEKFERAWDHIKKYWFLLSKD